MRQNATGLTERGSISERRHIARLELGSISDAASVDFTEAGLDCRNGGEEASDYIGLAS